MSGQFADERCAACGHSWCYHVTQYEGRGGWFGWLLGPRSYDGKCIDCPPEKRCQRFIPRPTGDEKREGEG